MMAWHAWLQSLASLVVFPLFAPGDIPATLRLYPSSSVGTAMGPGTVSDCGFASQLACPYRCSAPRRRYRNIDMRRYRLAPGPSGVCHTHSDRGERRRGEQVRMLLLRMHPSRWYHCTSWCGAQLSRYCLAGLCLSDAHAETLHVPVPVPVPVHEA